MLALLCRIRIYIAMHTFVCFLLLLGGWGGLRASGSGEVGWGGGRRRKTPCRSSFACRWVSQSHLLELQLRIFVAIYKLHVCGCKFSFAACLTRERERLQRKADSVLQRQDSCNSANAWVCGSPPRPPPAFTG